MAEKVKTVADLVVGDKVCAIGFGTANMLHEHLTVVRVTKQFVISKGTSNMNRGEVTRRHRRDNGHSVPRGDGYGGTDLYVTCQRAKKKD